MHEVQSVTERKNSRRTWRLTAGDTVTERTAAVGGAGKTGGEAEFQERILSCFFTRRWAASGDGGQVGVPMAWGHGRSQYDTFRCHWVKSEFQAL